MYRSLLSFLMIGFFLGGCASTPSEPIAQKQAEEPPLIEGRPTRAQCNERKDRALEVENWLRDYPNDAEAIQAVREEFETVLFHTGCHWLYSKPEEFQYHHLTREKMMQDVLRDYVATLADNNQLRIQINQLSDVITEKDRIKKLEQTLIELGGQCEEGNGSLICSFPSATQEWVPVTH